MTADATLPASDDLTPEVLARWEELAAKATAGPWVMTTQGGIEQAGYDGPGEVYDSVASVRDFDDWMFVSESRTAVPALLSGVRSRDARIVELEGALAKADRVFDKVYAENGRLHLEVMEIRLRSAGAING